MEGRGGRWQAVRSGLCGPSGLAPPNLGSSEEGVLYPLAAGLCFLPKPATFLPAEAWWGGDERLGGPRSMGSEHLGGHLGRRSWFQLWATWRGTDHPSLQRQEAHGLQQSGRLRTAPLHCCALLRTAAHCCSRLR